METAPTASKPTAARRRSAALCISSQIFRVRHWCLTFLQSSVLVMGLAMGVAHRCSPQLAFMSVLAGELLPRKIPGLRRSAGMPNGLDEKREDRISDQLVEASVPIRALRIVDMTLTRPSTGGRVGAVLHWCTRAMSAPMNAVDAMSYPPGGTKSSPTAF